MTFEITTTCEFSAAHQLVLYDGTVEPLHGHNWRVKVTVSARQLDSIGVVMDFHELERIVDVIVGPLHNAHLNEVPAFTVSSGGLNPTAENVALHVARSLTLPEQVALVSVEVWETQENSAIYRA